jgi:mono/diheme cytochrome c family protein
MKFKTILFTLVSIFIAILVWQWARPQAQKTVNVRVPPLSKVAARGKMAFDANCASCHGVNASGTDKGPPLVHDFYNPGHHADGAFFLAAKLGVRQHHWRFGDMPPQPQVTQEQLATIVRYVRELQAANGITYHPHRM